MCPLRLGVSVLRGGIPERSDGEGPAEELTPQVLIGYYVGYGFSRYAAPKTTGLA